MSLRLAGKYLGDAVYGALDGIVTTFAVVAGVAGASLSANVIIILGLANLFGDGVSMAAGNYLSKRSDDSYKKQEKHNELLDIERDPAKGKEELRRIYIRKGFSGDLLEKVVSTIMRDKHAWASETLASEHGLIEENISPIRAALITFGAFVIAGTVPLLVYLVAIWAPSITGSLFLAASIMTAIALFVVGSLRSLIIAKVWWRAGLEMLIVGGFAASVAYLVGFALQGLA